MPVHRGPKGPGTSRFARRQARIASRQNSNSGGAALRTRIGRPPGMPEVCRRYLARQAVGLLPTESIDED